MDFEKYKSSADFIKSKIGTADIAVVLGSGLGKFADSLEDRIKIPYAEIPNFPKSTAPSHEGAMYFGTINGKNIICMSGRFHYYEGYSLDEVTFYIRVLKLVGVEKIILTNAAGGINQSFKAGDLMLISDHINMTGLSPLRGINDDSFGTRFPDMTDAYSQSLRMIAAETAKKHNIDIKQGVYAYMTGPSYETPSEIRALSIMGADAVGMSTVPECVCAVHAGLEVLAISCITNMAAGITGEKLSEQEVIDTAAMTYQRFSSLVEFIIGEI